MSKIENLSDLRDHAVSVLERLEKKEINTDEAGIVAKLCENIISTVKVQLEFARMTKKYPKIDFLGNCTGALIESRSIKKLSIDEK